MSTVRELHGAVRASLRLRSGLDPGWTWSGHAEREFLRAARGHHVSGLIAPHAAELGMPPGLREDISRNADRVALKSLAHAGLLRQVHERLDAAGIPVLFFKGLAVEAQTGRPLGERGGGDIDLWVPPDHVEAAMEALRPEWTLPANYPQPGASWAWRHWQRWGSELPLHGPISVDLHWQLHGVRANLPDFAAARAAREEVVVGGRVLPTLGRAHALAHAVRHAETDRWRVLRSLVDVHLLLCPTAGATASALTVPNRTVAVVERAIGLPLRRTARPLSTREWAAVLEEQRHLGPHVDRIGRLSRPAYLRRLVDRRRGPGRHLMRDSLALLWFLAVAPPHASGTITTTSPVRGTGQAIARRFSYERDRAGRPDPAPVPGGRE